MKTIQFRDAYTIRIGNNQEENQTILQTMNPEDTWFHLSDFPSPHLAINVNFKQLDKETIYEISTILKQNTKFKKQNYVSITYTLRKDIRLTSKIGEVILNKGHKSIKV